MCQLFLEKGVPIKLKLEKDEIVRVPGGRIFTKESAIYLLENINGGILVKPTNYGIDPSEHRIDLQALRKQRFCEIFKNGKDIFSAVLQRNSVVFENAIAYFQNLTINLSQ